MPQKRKPMSPFAIGGEYREVAQPDDDADAMQEDGPGFQTASTPLTYTAKDSMPMSPVVLTSALTLDTRPVKTLASSLQAEEMSSPMRRIAKPRVNNFSFSSFRSLYPCLRGRTLFFSLNFFRSESYGSILCQGQAGARGKHFGEERAPAKDEKDCSQEHCRVIPPSLVPALYKIDSCF